MLDKSIISIARKRCQIEIGEQNPLIQNQITQLINEQNARGMLGSGSTFVKSADICCKAVKARAQFVWQTYYRFITTSGVAYSEGLEEELNSLVQEHLPEQLGDIKGYFNQAAKHGRNDKLMDRFQKEIDSARATALDTIETEIGLFVHSLSRKAETKDEPSHTVVNVYSPVGSIQTGQNSVANVAQSIDSESKDALVAALSQLQGAIESLHEEYSINTVELEELVTESTQELDKENPNSMKIKGLLSGIAGSIQTTASLKPAYESLKIAASFIGLTLP